MALIISTPTPKFARSGLMGGFTAPLRKSLNPPKRRKATWPKRLHRRRVNQPNLRRARKRSKQARSLKKKLQQAKTPKLTPKSRNQSPTRKTNFASCNASALRANRSKDVARLPTQLQF